MRWILMACAIACFSLIDLSESNAQPGIGGVDGTLERGSQITINGYAFGSKDQAEPFAWDDFQDGTPGEYLVDRDQPGGGVWDLQAYECRLPVYANSIQRFSGDVCALQDHDGDRGPPEWPSGCGTNRGLGLIDRPSKVWYVSYWEYQHDWNNTALSSTNVKLYSHFMSHSWNNNGGTSFPRYDLRWGEMWDGPSGYLAAYDCYADHPAGRIHQSYGMYRDHRNRWVRIETFVDMGDPGVANGYHAAFAELSLLNDFAGIMTPTRCAEVSNEIGSWFIGLAFFNDNDAVIRRYLSELYVDHSFARVEIGDAPNWDDCTHREIQIPTSWSNNSITVTSNVGTFTTGSQVYVFVVDEERRPSIGFPVIIGEDNQQGDLGVPGVPGTVTFTQIED